MGETLYGCANGTVPPVLPGLVHCSNPKEYINSSIKAYPNIIEHYTGGFNPLTCEGKTLMLHTTYLLLTLPNTGDFIFRIFHTTMLVVITYINV